MSSPHFDLHVFNPVRWPVDPSRDVGALGPVDLLPPGVEADSQSPNRNRPLRLRRYRYLVDVKAFHRNDARRAGELARLAAAGVVIHVAEADAGLGRLDAELQRLMRAHPGALDAGQREMHCIRMRRTALRSHSLWARNAAELPSVSVVVATKHPGAVERTLSAVARQTYPRLELVLALHGDTEPGGDVEARVGRLPFAATVVRVPGAATLGAVLNEASAAASGALLTKMDDDDLYDADHVWDLVLAREYAGAELVGKLAQFVYLAASNQTVHIRRGEGEAHRRGLAGGTLLIARADLNRIGGWRNVVHAVDLALEEDVARAGGHIYSTHGAGFMLVRHGRSHTWRKGDNFFLGLADRIVPGWVPELAGFVGESSAPAP